MGSIKYKKGITIIETLLYATILILVVGIITQSLITLYRLNRETYTDRLIERNASSAMEVITGEIREAISVDINPSVFASNPGTITLNKKDDSGTPYSITFVIENGILKSIKNPGNNVSQISSSNVIVSGLIFELGQNSNTEGVRVFLQVEKNVGNETKMISLRSFNILRGSY